MLQKSHDSLGRVQEIKTSHWSQTVPHKGYDEAGRLTRSMTQDSLGLTRYSYDYTPLDHLQKEEGHATHSYMTDSIDNRIEKDGAPYKVNTLNQLTHQNGWEYSYNANGNLIEKKRGSEKTSYHYDTMDRLVKVSSPSQTTTYHYDAFNRRVSKTSQGKKVRFLYLGQNEIGP